MQESTQASPPMTDLFSNVAGAKHLRSATARFWNTSGLASRKVTSHLKSKRLSTAISSLFGPTTFGCKRTEQLTNHQHQASGLQISSVAVYACELRTAAAYFLPGSCNGLLRHPTKIIQRGNLSLASAALARLSPPCNAQPLLQLQREPPCAAPREAELG